MDSHKVFRWSSSGKTDTGRVRKINEDAFLERPDIGLWVVADGMGGHQAGDLASKTVIEGLKSLDSNSDIEAFVRTTINALQDVNSELFEYANSQDSMQLGSTVAVLLTARDKCAFLWAGDSRIYRIRDSVTEAVTSDHSHVEELIQQGLLSREDAENHPQSNVITRAIGAQQECLIDVNYGELVKGDTYLLCSDGLYNEMSESEIGMFASTKKKCNELTDALMKEVLARGARDNVTVISVDIS